MNYWIFVFNKKTIEPINEEGLLERITDSNFEILCRQYGLDPLMIQPTLAQLQIVLAPKDLSPFFLLQYHPQGKRPIVVYRWDSHQDYGKALLQDAVGDNQQEEIQEHLAQTQYLIGIELAQSQLRDMGLLLAYEVARWAADVGHGLLRGVDGKWYRLNLHKAFIPLKEPHSEPRNH